MTTWRPRAVPKSHARIAVRPASSLKVEGERGTVREAEAQIVHLVRLADELLTRAKILLPGGLPRG